MIHRATPLGLASAVVLILFSASAAATPRGQTECSGVFYGTVGFLEADDPPQFRAIPNAVVVLTRGRDEVRVPTDDSGDYFSASFECGAYTLRRVLAPDGTELSLRRRQPRSFRITSERLTVLNVAVDPHGAIRPEWASTREPSRLVADCSSAPSPLEIRLSVASATRKHAFADRELVLRVRNIGRTPLRLLRQALVPVRIFDRVGVEVWYLPDYPGGPPGDYTENDVLALAPGAVYEERFSLGDYTEDPLENGPYYVRAYYYPATPELPSGRPLDAIRACSNIVTVQ